MRNMNYKKGIEHLGRLVLTISFLAAAGCAAGPRRIAPFAQYRQAIQTDTNKQLRELRQRNDELDNKRRLRLYKKMIEDRELEEEFAGVHFVDEKPATHKEGEMCELHHRKLCAPNLLCSFEGQWFNDKFGKCERKEHAQSYKVWLKIRRIKLGY